MVRETSLRVSASVFPAELNNSVSVAAYNDFTPVEDLFEIAGLSANLVPGLVTMETMH